MKRLCKKISIIVLLIGLPFLVYFSYFGVTGGGQPQAPDLFSPLYRAYEFLKGHYLHSQEVTDQELLHGAIEGMIKKLDDPYSRFLNQKEYKQFNDQLEGEFVGVGIQITVKDDYPKIVKPLDGSPAKRAGIKAGDIILKIDGQPAKGLSQDQVVEKLQGPEGEPVLLTVQHQSGEVEEITVIRELIVVESVKSRLIDKQIGFIEISSFNNHTPANLVKALKEFEDREIKGLIIDLRDNPGGLLHSAIQVASQFVDEGMVIKTVSRSGEDAYQTRGNDFPNLPMAVLINSGTASASEIVAGAIRAHQMGILVGRKSFGKGLVQETYPLKDGSAVILTTAEFYTSTDQKIHQVGLFPDIEVLDASKDLERATEWIKAHLDSRCPCTISAQELMTGKRPVRNLKGD